MAARKDTMVKLKIRYTNGRERRLRCKTIMEAAEIADEMRKESDWAEIRIDCRRGKGKPAAGSQPQT